MLLSCVILARNEQENISRCIQSVISHTNTISQTEILLVDSCSSDKTIEIATGYPINIISLRPEWRLSPAAGRFSGVNNTRGDYVLIIDGDMELREGWVEIALKYMGENERVGAVVGKHYDVYSSLHKTYDKPRICTESNLLEKKRDEINEVEYVFRSSVFRRKCLVEVGNFQPYLRAEEEAEISSRLRRRGYDLAFLPYDSIYHYCIAKDTLKETVRRARSKLTAGMGDMFSWCLRNGHYSIVWKRFKKYLMFLAYMGMSISGALIFALLGEFRLALTSGLLIPAFALLLSIKKRSMRRGLVSLTNFAIHSLALVGGLFRGIPEISSYPTEVVWIKRKLK